MLTKQKDKPKKQKDEPKKQKDEPAIDVETITRMVDELVKGKGFKDKANKFYEANRKKFVAIINHTKATIFFGTKKKLVFTKGKRKILDQKKLEDHFGGIIPDRFYTNTDCWECAIQSLDE